MMNFCKQSVARLVSVASIEYMEQNMYSSTDGIMQYKFKHCVHFTDKNEHQCAHCINRITTHMYH